MRSTTTAPPARRLPWLALLQLPLLLSTASAQMPYNPTRVLHNGTHLYVFQPSSSSSTQARLSSIDISAHIDAAKPHITTLYTTLPFLDDQHPLAFTPVIDDQGSLTVYAGNCSQGASGGQVWRFSPDPSDAKRGGSWLQEDVSVKESSHVASMGANYLNNGISFSSIIGGDDMSTGVYLFGGMCPLATDDSNDWQMAANYSNLMVTLDPSSKTDESLTYQLDISTSRGPPVPEAGFTMTGLTPTFADRSDGSQTQQRNFLLIGGHTSSAFINMSQIALFSLPEESWTFIGVGQPETSQTDLAIREAPTVDPRSGHTAVLTPDGQKIIVYGGWVGDVDTPADPQLAILNIADGYGGTGDWKWTIPTSPSGAGIAADSGLYGHGAAMLPGGVMMVTGGYSIPGSGARRRRDSPSLNSQTYFLNITSNTWMTDYTPPGASDSAPNHTAPLSSLGQKAGLGIGIGMGLVCSLFAFYVWYTKRLKNQRDIREKQLQDLSMAAHRYNIDDYPSEFDSRGGQADAAEYLTGQNSAYYFSSGHQGGQGWKSSSGHDVERTGLLLEIPSPTRGLRRGVNSRTGYSMVTNRGPGPIHPIDELEEEDEDRTADNILLNGYPEMNECGNSIINHAPAPDPFVDTHYYGSEKRHLLRPASSSPTHGEVGEPSRLDHCKPDWSLEIAAVTTHRSNTDSTGRKSPDKSTEKPSTEERTGSNLSEKSARSNLSYESSHGSLGRSPSLRAGAILTPVQANPFRTPDSSPVHDRPRRYSESGRQTPGRARTQSLTSTRSNGRADVESFRSAHSTFAHLQAEGEVLLGGNPDRARPGTSSTAKSSVMHDDAEASSSRAATATPATSNALDLSHTDTRDVRKSWLGSVRRVLRRSISGADRTRPHTATMSYHEPYTDIPVFSPEPSTDEHRKSFPVSLPPRRAASDASFWKSRRGKQDWEDELESTWARTSGDDWGAPEDIVLAEKERRRQEWRERGKLLVNLTDNDELPTPRTPIKASELGFPDSNNRPGTPADEGDWDVEAAVERRVVQVMFTVPKSKLRVVNADPDRSSILSLPRENSKEGDELPTVSTASSPSKVRDLASRFERMSGASQVSTPKVTPRASPVPSPSASIRSMKIRTKPSSSSLSRQSMRNSATHTLGVMDGKAKIDE
jgi:hypothetical protein